MKVICEVLLLVLRRKPTQRKFICSMLVLLSLFVCLLPKMIPALGADKAPGAKGVAGVLWPLCFMIGFVPAAAMNVIEEKVMKMTNGARREQISLIWFLFWESVYQFLCAAALFWTDIIPGFGNSADIHDFGENVAFGFLCFFGGRGCTSEPGTRGTVFILGYAVSYFGGGLLLRHAEGATMLALVSSLVTPLGFLFWTLFEEDPFHFQVNTGNATWFSLGALALMVPSIYFYNTGSQRAKMSIKSLFNVMLVIVIFGFVVYYHTKRYAISHHLSVLMPTGGNMLAWPFPPAEEDYVHTPDEQYDVLLSHMVYNKTWLRTKFPTNTAYISIIREPSSHLRSAMNFYRLPELLKIKSKNPVQTFLQEPWKYKDLSEAYFDFCNVTWDGTRNFLSFDLGYPTDGAEDNERARRYTGQLEVDFTTMLILENLDESLILLRRMMCWEVRDVLYDMTPKNSRNYSYKEYVPTAEELGNLRLWKAVDYLLYDTFNASLWRKIAAHGPDFHDELRYFKELNKRVSTYCDKRRKDGPDLTVAASKWNSEFQVDAYTCSLIKSDVSTLMMYIRKDTTNGRKEYDIMGARLNVAAIIKGQPTYKYKTEQDKYEKSRSTS
uniref:Uncharacterized protein n=1 Tax=Branchiostoma floridae TaxID=7739 RepID=C3YBH8_BRAFL|eukprot:XP_002606325.1 hypothetical protein BRAFLDRAFT_67567 [Branchiostoma floridae]